MKIIDLTMPIDENTPVYPGDKPQHIGQQATIAKDGWNEKRLEFSSHLGTHIDAPFHMLQGGKKLDEFPMEKFMGEAITIDARKTNGRNEIQVDLEKVKESDIVLFYTGHTKKANNKEFFENNPVISAQLARKLAEKKVKIVGIDSYTPDNSPFVTHKILLGADILIVENLVNIGQLAGKRFKCYILPIKIRDADGAPCRAIAEL